MKKIMIFTIFILISGCERNEVANKEDIELELAFALLITGTPDPLLNK